MTEGDCSRLEAFLQLKKEIRGSEDYLVVGIDVAKEEHHAFFGTANGKTLFRRLVFDNDPRGFEKLLNQVRVMQIQEGPSVPMMMRHRPL